MNRKKRTILGVTGGVGAGKSSVLELLKTEFGARVILADETAHGLMEPGSEGLRRVVKELGDSFLSPAGCVDKKRLADLIFHDDTALEKINAIIHPMVWERVIREAKEAEEALVVIEAAVFSGAPADFFDEIWYIDTAKENRISRLMESRGYTREKCESIIANQASEADYRLLCSRIIDNNGSPDDVKKKLKEILAHEICQYCQREQR
ncbi:MAG: dephospho-CoA kinase [Lachnospiraceae bacterium]|nr:dephospho-CoA kinase [Lachnospiraceae bacterium]